MKWKNSVSCKCGYMNVNKGTWVYVDKYILVLEWPIRPFEVAGYGSCSEGEVCLRGAQNQPFRVPYCRWGFLSLILVLVWIYITLRISTWEILERKKKRNDKLLTSHWIHTYRLLAVRLAFYVNYGQFLPINCAFRYSRMSRSPVVEGVSNLINGIQIHCT